MYKNKINNNQFHSAINQKFPISFSSIKAHRICHFTLQFLAKISDFGREFFHLLSPALVIPLVSNTTVIIIINIKDWILWSVPSPQLQLLEPTLLRSSNCSPSLWSVVIWFQRDSVLWHSLQVWKPVPSVFIYLVQYACNPQFAAYVVICFVVIKGVACQRSQ